MEIELYNIGKRYKRSWIFKDVSYKFPAGSHSIITGANGSGKSTLIQIIAGFLHPSKGEVRWIQTEKNSLAKAEEVPHLVSIAAPYLDLFDDLTLAESIEFHFRFRNNQQQLKCKEITDLLELQPHANKALRYFSSGMKQRVRLGLAILTNSPILLLDEPTSNLDHRAIAWYHELLSASSENRTVIVSTNMNQADYLRADAELKIPSA